MLFKVATEGVILQNCAGNVLLDTNYISKVYAVYFLGATSHFWQRD